MPIVSIKKAYKPSYVESKITNPEIRHRYKITTPYEPRFQRAFINLSRNFLDSHSKKNLAVALKELYAGKKTVDEAVSVLDWYNPADPLSSKRWELLSQNLKNIYKDIIEESGDKEAQRHGWKFKFTIEKAAVPVVPINPYSLDWVETSTGRLIVEISEQQRESVRQMIERGFAAGERPEAIMDKISNQVGLTSREQSWVANKEQQMFDAGIPEDKIANATERYSKKLLKERGRRIARTETIEAYSQGLNDSWKMAVNEGIVPRETKKEWVELTLSPRTCAICKGLAGQTVPIDEPFISDILGEVDRPPSHPNCRCTMFLVDDENIKE